MCSVTSCLFNSSHKDILGVLIVLSRYWLTLSVMSWKYNSSHNNALYFRALCAVVMSDEFL